MNRVMCILLALVTSVAVADDLEDRIEEAIQDVEQQRSEYVIHKVIQWGGVGLAIAGIAVAGNALEDADGNPSGEVTPLVIAGYSIGAGGVAISVTDYLLTKPRRDGIARAELRVNALLAEKRRADQRRRIARFTEREQEAIIADEIFIGMSEEALVESLGRPLDVNRTVTANSESKQYVYPNSVYVYVENGVVTSWQD